MGTGLFSFLSRSVPLFQRERGWECVILLTPPTMTLLRVVWDTLWGELGEETSLVSVSVLVGLGQVKWCGPVRKKEVQ